MLTFLILVAAYLLAGLLIDVLIHFTYPVVYWDVRQAIVSHLYITLVWPRVLFLYLNR